MNNELIEAAKSVIARWDTPLWKHAEPTAEVMNRLRNALAALSAKPTLHWSDCATSNRGTPELEGPCDCGGYTPEPSKLPEVEEFLENKCTTIDNLDESTWVIEVDHVGEFLDQLTAAHAAALVEATITGTNITAETLAIAKEQGRREALAYDPPIPDEIKGRVQAEWFWKGVLAMKQSALGGG